MYHRRATVVLVFALVVGVAVVAGLHAVEPPVPIDWSRPVRWLGVTPLEDAVASLGRVAGLAAGYWFVVSTLLYLAARLSRHARAIRLTGLLASPTVRRLVDRAVAGVLVTGLLGSPALAAGRVPADYLPFDPPPAVAAPPATPTTGWTEVEVVPGDNLWRISRRHLADLGDEGPVAPYWRQVVDTNRPHLRSGDPDLIYPGEVIRLPPPDVNPDRS